MPGRTPELGTKYICSAHNLPVKPGAGEAPLEHVGGNAGKPCTSQMFTRTERRKVDRAEVLAELAGPDGGP